MFIFLRLLLSHFIADFPLQLKGVYRLKLTKVWGSFVHSAVVVLVCTIMCLPFLKYPEMWVIIFWVWIIHGLQDWIKVAYCEKAKKDNLWIFILLENHTSQPSTSSAGTFTPFSTILATDFNAISHWFFN